MSEISHLHYMKRTNAPVNRVRGIDGIVRVWILVTPAFIGSDPQSGERVTEEDEDMWGAPPEKFWLCLGPDRKRRRSGKPRQRGDAA